MREIFDPSVYFIIDPAVCGGEDFIDITRTAVKGGVTLVQLRNKIDGADVIVQQGARLMEMLQPFGTPLIINDYVQIAKNIGAHGVHVGQGDISLAAAREIMGEQAIIGVTAFEEGHMKEIDQDIVDYVGCGPCYPTLTKPDKPVLGLETFSKLALMCPVPIVGIGGITPKNASDVIKAGASGVAMMRSISQAQDPQEAAYEFVSSVAAARLYSEAQEVL